MDLGLVGLVGAIVCVAVGRAAFPAYLDNAAHLLELHVLAEQVVPMDHWYAGWTDLAEAGTPVGLLNAPLCWLAIAGLSRLGLPLVGLYQFATVSANVVLGLAAARLAGRLSRAPGAALWGGLLAAGMVTEVWGVGGATGGMWPYRLGLAGLLGVVGAHQRAPRAGTVAVAVALLWLIHTFTGLLVVAWYALEGARHALRREWDALGRIVLGGVVGVATAGFFLYPIVTSDIGRFPNIQLLPWDLWQVALLAVTSADPYWLPSGNLRWLGGGAGAVAFVLAWIGVLLGAVGWRRSRGGPQLGPGEDLPPGRVATLGVFVAAVAVVAGGSHLFGSITLGPVPWRYFAVVHLALAIAGGIGMAQVLGSARARAVGWIAAGAVGFAGAAVGLTQVPAREGEARAAWDAMEAAWADAAGLAGGSRIYIDDPMQDKDAPPALAWTHPGPLLTLATGLPTLGSWYGIVNGPTHEKTFSESGFLLGLTRSQVYDHPEQVSLGLRVFGVGVVVAFSEPLRFVLDGQPGWEAVSFHGPFVVYRATEPVLPLLASPDAETTVVLTGTARNRFEASVVTAAPTRVRLRQTWHPWWRASLDGQPLPLGEPDDFGFVDVVVPRSGSLVLAWEVGDVTPGLAMSVVGLLALVGLVATRR